MVYTNEELLDGCLIRYLIEEKGYHKERTALIIESGPLLKAYWPHMERVQPDEREMEEPWLCEQYTKEGWKMDVNLISVHPPIKTRADIDLWLMLYPEDEYFIKTWYLEVYDENSN